MNQFGVSFSVKYAKELDVDPKACLEAVLKELCIKKLRLMSYWDVHEPTSGKYDFKELDWQFSLAKNYGAKISLAIGLRQPRWPESHWPAWAQKLPSEAWQASLLKFIETVVKRYKDHASLESWQLENEAMLKTFGINGNFDRTRLMREFILTKKLDPNHPIIMTTSDSWGIPLRQPRPDIYGISIYRRFYDRNKYRKSHRPAQFYKLRGKIIELVTNRQVFIHELQAEPWGPVATSELSLFEQYKTMNPEYFIQTLNYALKTGLLPAYCWGLEWWYWLHITDNDSRIWLKIKQFIKNTSCV